MMQQKYKWLHTSIHPHGPSDDKGYTYLQWAKQAKYLWCVPFLYLRSLIIYVHQTDPETKYLVNSSTVKNGKNLCSLSHGELT